MYNVMSAVLSSINELNTPKKTRKKIDPYTKILNTIIEHEKLSAISKQLISYLTHRPKSWIPRPTDIKRYLNCGDFVWRKVCKELKEAGYLRLKSGGNGRGGSQLEFDAKGRFRDVGDLCVQNNSETLATNVHINNINSINKQYIKQTTIQHTDEVVVCLIQRLKNEVELTEESAIKCVKTNLHKKIVEKLEMLKQAKNVISRTAWFMAALKNDYPSNPKISNAQEVKVMSFIKSEDSIAKTDSEAKGKEACQKYNERLKTKSNISVGSQGILEAKAAIRRVNIKTESNREFAERMDKQRNLG